MGTDLSTSPTRDLAIARSSLSLRSCGSYPPALGGRWGEATPLVIAIEQPELHLHPALQAKLANAFRASIELAKKNHCNLQLLIETHSETIVNFFGRAIARKIMSPKDVSVVLFEKKREQNQTEVRISQYDEAGYLQN